MGTTDSTNSSNGRAWWDPGRNAAGALKSLPGIFAGANRNLSKTSAPCRRWNVDSIVGYGHTILITHGYGYISVYAHLSEILVKQGELVQAKQEIEKVGETGSLIGEVLYFELWHDYKRLDTKKWLMRYP